MGLFIVFEGIEGSGKTTQAQALRERLYSTNPLVELIREPGGTPLGDELRNLLKYGVTEINAVAELLLFNAARAQLVSDVIKPRLEEGVTVISDRFFASTIAYQGYGRGLPISLVEGVCDVSRQGVSPDLTVLLDLEPAEGFRRQEYTVRDRFDREQTSFQLGMLERSETGETATVGRSRERRPKAGRDLTFYERVRRGYLTLAKQDPVRWLTIDATLPEGDISQMVWEKAEALAQE